MIFIAYHTKYFFIAIFINLLPGFLRIHALSDPKKNRECLYKFSQFIESVTSFMNDIFYCSFFVVFIKSIIIKISLIC